MSRCCNRCSTTENVTSFRHFDTGQDEWLCWEHRKPIVMSRLHPEQPEQIEPEQQEATGSGGQSILGEFL